MSTNRSPQWRGISRIDHKHTHGWFARVYLKGKRVRSKLFSDGVYGSPEEALKEAQAWRDSEKEKLSPEDRPKKIRYRKTLPKRNTSGRVGVSKTFSRQKGDNDGKLWCFSVTWAPKPGKPKNRAFYFNTYGSEEAAFKAACEFRAAKEREIDGQELSKEERGKYLKEMIGQIMAYIEKAPEDRQERLRALHALVLGEFPDVDMWLKCNHPCYQRGENWVMIANRKRSFSIHFHATEDFATFLPNHPKSLIGYNCVNFKDHKPLELDEVKKLIRKSLENPALPAKPDSAEGLESPAGEKQGEQPEDPARWAGRITKAIKKYILRTPKDVQDRLFELHRLILGAFPAVKLSMKFKAPTYERGDMWIALSHQQTSVVLQAGNTVGIAEFAEKHPEIPSEKDSVGFPDNAEFLIEDLQMLVVKALIPALPPKSDVIPEEEEEKKAEEKVSVNEEQAVAATPEASAAPKRKRGHPKKAPEQEVSAAPKRKRGRPRKTKTVQVPAEIQAYLEKVPNNRRERLTNLHAMVIAACPDVEVSMKHNMPSYERQGKWLAFGNLSSYISFYVSDSESIKDFVARHPEIKSGKATLNFTDGVEIPESDVQLVARKALTAVEVEGVTPEADIVKAEADANQQASPEPEARIRLKRKPGRPRKTPAPKAAQAEAVTVQETAQQEAGIAAPETMQPQKPEPERPVRTPQAKPAAEMPVFIEMYIQTAPKKRQKRLRWLHDLIVKAYPNVKMSMKFRMATYEWKGVWIGVRNQEQHIAFYVKEGIGIDAFVAKHPDIQYDNISLKLTDDVRLPRKDLTLLIQEGFGPAESQPATAEDKPQQPKSFDAAPGALAPKRGKRGRPRKAQAAKGAQDVAAAQVETKQKPAAETPSVKKPKTGRPRKAQTAEARQEAVATPTDTAQNVVTEVSAEISAPKKRKPGRPRKVKAPESVPETTTVTPETDWKSVKETVSETPASGKRKRGRPRKTKQPETGQKAAAVTPEPKQTAAAGTPAEIPASGKRKRGRPRKSQAAEIAQEAVAAPADTVQNVMAEVSAEVSAPRKRKPGRPRKTKAPEIVPEAATMTSGTGQKPVNETVSETSAPGKRKRGRPKKTKKPENVQKAVAVTPAPEQTAVAETSAEIPAPKKRKPGRPRKSKKTVRPNAVNAPKTLQQKPAETRAAMSNSEGQLRHMLESVMGYITQCPAKRQQQLLVLHALIIGECPHAQLSMKGGIPTYEFGDRWVSLANLQNYISLYAEDRESLAEFAAKHPEIKAGKTCLNFIDGDEIPLSGVRELIQKALTPKIIEMPAGLEAA